MPAISLTNLIFSVTLYPLPGTLLTSSYVFPKIVCLLLYELIFSVLVSLRIILSYFILM